MSHAQYVVTTVCVGVAERQPLPNDSTARNRGGGWLKEAWWYAQPPFPCDALCGVWCPTEYRLLSKKGEGTFSEVLKAQV